MENKDVKKATRLEDLTVEEVSMVDVPANKRTWLVVKGDHELAEKVRTFQKALEGDSQAVTEVLRLLLAMLSDETLKALGLQRIANETMEDNMQGNESTKNESQTKAQEGAQTPQDDVKTTTKGEEGGHEENAPGDESVNEKADSMEGSTGDTDSTLKALDAVMDKINEIASKLADLDKRLDSVEKRNRVPQTEADHVEKKDDENETVDLGAQAYAPVFKD